MKYIKYYEEVYNDENEPHVYDYVIMISSVDTVKNFIENNIGQIIEIDRENYDVTVKYFNIPSHLKEYFVNNSRIFGLRKIKHWSKNKEDLIPFIQSNKYNL